MPLSNKCPPVTNEATSAESNVVKIEKHEENPVTVDITMKRSHSPGEYVLFCDLIYSRVYCCPPASKYVKLLSKTSYESCYSWMPRIISNMRDRVLPHSKHQEESGKYGAQWSSFAELRGVWKFGRTLSRMFDRSPQSRLKLRRERRNQIVKIYANQHQISKHQVYRQQMPHEFITFEISLSSVLEIDYFLFVTFCTPKKACFNWKEERSTVLEI